MATSRKHFEIAGLLKRHPDLVLTLMNRALVRATLPDEYLRSLLSFPEFRRAVVGEAEATSDTVAERFADGVVIYYDELDVAGLALAIEIQLSGDDEKIWRWPDYLVGTRTRLRCPTEILAVCLDSATARWAAQPIRLGYGTSHVAPLVVTPEDFTGTLPGATPKDALLMASLVYSGHPNDAAARRRIIKNYVKIRKANPGEAAVYADLVSSIVQGEARRRLEDEMVKTEGFTWESDIGQRYWTDGRAEGKAEGKAETLLQILAHRGVAVSDEARQRILTCTDAATLEAWVDKALDATSIEEVLD